MGAWTWPWDWTTATALLWVNWVLFAAVVYGVAWIAYTEREDW